jgi:hypothetical protein
MGDDLLFPLFHDHGNGLARRDIKAGYDVGFHRLHVEKRGDFSEIGFLDKTAAHGVGVYF